MVSFTIGTTTLCVVSPGAKVRVPLPPGPSYSTVTVHALVESRMASIVADPSASLTVGSVNDSVGVGGSLVAATYAPFCTAVPNG